MFTNSRSGGQHTHGCQPVVSSLAIAARKRGDCYGCERVDCAGMGRSGHGVCALINPRGGGVHSVHIRSWVLSSRTRSREGWCLLAMGLATAAQSIIPVLSALKILDH